jgi:hypothetical protein
MPLEYPGVYPAVLRAVLVAAVHAHRQAQRQVGHGFLGLSKMVAKLQRPARGPTGTVWSRGDGGSWRLIE